jgi:hypothetical protein
MTHRIRTLPTANLQTHRAFPHFGRTVRPLRWLRAIRYPR